MKIVGKFILLLAGIAALYFGLSQVNWSKLFELDEKQEKLEKRLGKLVINELENTMTIIRDDSVKQIVDSLFNPLASKNGIPHKSYKIIVVEDSQINAFALPDRHIVLTTGIINFLDSANYLSAILAHEMAHCEKKHVMKSLITQFGLDLLLSGSGTSEVTNFLTGQAFIRKLEREADEQALVYLEEARVDPKSLQQVMELFDVYLTGDLDLTWASTHPSPSDRKAYIEAKIETLDADADYRSPIQSSTWKKLQLLIENYSPEVD